MIAPHISKYFEVENIKQTLVLEIGMPLLLSFLKAVGPGAVAGIIAVVIPSE